MGPAGYLRSRNSIQCRNIAIQRRNIASERTAACRGKAAPYGTLGWQTNRYWRFCFSPFRRNGGARASTPLARSPAHRAPQLGIAPPLSWLQQSRRSRRFSLATKLYHRSEGPKPLYRNFSRRWRADHERGLD
jgi:hypothetical protein